MQALFPLLCSTIFVSILITSVFNCASDRLALSSSLSSIFSGGLIFHLSHIFLSWRTCYVVRGGALGTHQGGATHITALWCCMQGRGPKGNNEACSTLLVFGHFPHYSQSNWVLLVLIPRWVGLCTFQDPVGLSNELSCEARSFSRHLNLHRCFQSEVWGFISPS